MMSMINANFNNQDTKAGTGIDPAEKDANGDQFTTLMAGFFAPVSAPVQIKTVEPAAELAPEPVTAPAPEASAAESSDLFVKTAGENVVPYQKYQLGSLLPGGKQPSLPVPAADASDQFFSQKNGAEIRPDENVVPFIKTKQSGANSGAGATEIFGHTGRTCLDLTGGNTGGIKPVVKDLKTQLSKFEQVTALAAPLANAKTLAAMEKQKAALVAGLNENAIQVLTDQATDQIAEPNATHLDHTYVPDANSLAMGDEVWTPVKLRKLISKVTELTAGENAPLLNKELVIEQARSALPKVSAMLEQIEPKMMELAAATLTHGKQSLKIRLHPAELGTVEISLERNDAGVLNAHIKTDNNAARDILAKGLDQLRDSLQNAGWQIGQVDISTSQFSTGGNQNQKDAWQRQDTSQDRPGGSGFEKDAAGSDDPSLPDPDRLVSLRA